MLPSQGLRVGEESLGMRFGQCALYTRAGAERRAWWVSLRNALHWAQRHVPSFLNPMGVCYSGQADREWSPTEVASSHSWREGTLLPGASPVPWCLNSAGQQQCLCLQGFPLRCHCSPCAVNKAVLLPGWAVPPPLKGRSSTCSPSWLKPLVWHCHPEPLCKYQNYSKAPLWSLLNSQVKKVFWKLLLSSSH